MVAILTDPGGPVLRFLSGEYTDRDMGSGYPIDRYVRCCGILNSEPLACRVCTSGSEAGRRAHSYMGYGAAGAMASFVETAERGLAGSTALDDEWTARVDVPR